ncbi:MAG: ribonuclease P protein component [Leucobacter sp.]|nr:ribonuclease P protein component [Leucobacter sp.]
MPAKRHRILRGDDFRRIVRGGNRVGGATCITHAVLHVESHTPARFGFIVSKAVGNAVTRNRVRRRMKSLAQQRISQGFAGADVVFRVLPAAAEATFHELTQDVTRALDRVQELQRSRLLQAAHESH